MKKALVIILFLAGCGGKDDGWRTVCAREEMTTQLMVGPQAMIIVQGGMPVGSGIGIANRVECVEWKRVCSRKDGSCP